MNIENLQALLQQPNFLEDGFLSVGKQCYDQSDFSLALLFLQQGLIVAKNEKIISHIHYYIILINFNNDVANGINYFLEKLAYFSNNLFCELADTLKSRIKETYSELIGDKAAQCFLQLGQSARDRLNFAKAKEYWSFGAFLVSPKEYHLEVQFALKLSALYMETSQFPQAKEVLEVIFEKQDKLLPKDLFKIYQLLININLVTQNIPEALNLYKQILEIKKFTLTDCLTILDAFTTYYISQDGLQKDFSSLEIALSYALKAVKEEASEDKERFYKKIKTCYLELANHDLATRQVESFLNKIKQASECSKNTKEELYTILYGAEMLYNLIPIPQQSIFDKIKELKTSQFLFERAREFIPTLFPLFEKKIMEHNIELYLSELKDRLTQQLILISNPENPHEFLKQHNLSEDAFLIIGKQFVERSQYQEALVIFSKRPNLCRKRQRRCNYTFYITLINIHFHLASGIKYFLDKLEHFNDDLFCNLVDLLKSILLRRTNGALPNKFNKLYTNLEVKCFIKFGTSAKERKLQQVAEALLAFRILPCYRYPLFKNSICSSTH